MAENLLYLPILKIASVYMQFVPIRPYNSRDSCLSAHIGAAVLLVPNLAITLALVTLDTIVPQQVTTETNNPHIRYRMLFRLPPVPKKPFSSILGIAKSRKYKGLQLEGSKNYLTSF